MPIVIPLAVWLAGLILLGLAITARVWATAMIKVLAAGRGGGITRIITLPLRLIERVVTPGVNYMTHVLTKAAVFYTHPIARWFDAWALWYTGTVSSVLHFAESVAVSVERSTTVVLPREIGKAQKHIPKRVGLALGLGSLGFIELPLLGRGIDALLKELGGLNKDHIKRAGRGIDRLLKEHLGARVHTLERTVAHAIPREFGRVRARERKLERYVYGKLTRHLDLLAKLLGLGVLAGLIVKTLARRFPWLFCRKVTGVGRRVCGLDQDLLNALLMDTIAIAGTISLLEFAEDLQGLTEPAVAVMKATIREF